MNRHELETQLRTVLNLCPADAVTTCAPCETRITEAMALIDQYKTSQPRELWTAEEVASFLGRDSTHSARAWLSQNNIKREGDQPSESGRMQSLYPADEVRAICFRKALT